MVDVIRVYNIVRDIANKDQKGFISPNVFNTFADIAQRAIFNEMFNELKMAVALRRGGKDAGRDKSAYKMVEEDLATYIVNATITTDQTTEVIQVQDEDGNLVDEFNVVDNDGAFIIRRPNNLARLISMTETTNQASVEIVHDSEKANRILTSNLSAPTAQFPVCMDMGDTYHIFPATLAGVNVRYYRQPRSRFAVNQTIITGPGNGVLPDTVDVLVNEVDLASSPRLAVIEVNQNTGLVVPNLQLSRNFDLPEHYTTEVVAEICQLIGVSLRDNVLMQYGTMETQAE
jgi:hypothetical protein